MASNLLIKHLQNASLFDHKVDYFKVIETHISWVLLTGSYAYKIKKPLNLDFLDFSSLEKRKVFYLKELELNQKLAPEIYLEVLPITGSEENPEINGQGKIIEYAIKMREFSQETLFNTLLQKKSLHPSHMVDLAHVLAHFHDKTDRKSLEYFGTPDQILEPVKQNFEQIREMIKEESDFSKLKKIESWTYQEHQKLLSVFKKRKQLHFIRACHGDVHLGNITLFNNKPVLFDCIEFNESFRWTDTMADIGFLLMDLHEKKAHRFANILLNTYMMHTGDYEGLSVLMYYQVYRAIVRAKISLYEYIQQSDPVKANHCLQRYRHLIELALSFIAPKTPMLLLTHGLSGSGKSTLAKLLVEELGLIQLRSDVERKRLAGIPFNGRSTSGLYSDLYSEKQTKATYQSLLHLTKITLDSHTPVIVDATFQSKHTRDLFIQLATEKAIPYCILYCEASFEKLLEGVNKRSKNNSISEANKEVLIAQQKKFEPLTDQEIKHSVCINTDNPVDVNIILKSIREIIE